MSEPRICDVGGSGIIFPLFESEQTWPKPLRAVLYALAMIYLFLGVNIVADKFVSSIEVITSKQRRWYDKKSGRVITRLVWNSTVANLTLLALGSSAPEILLSIMECVGRGFRAGDLGPSTIVGSAAFNLFMIIAVCILSIPSPEVRRIKQQGVFVVTAIFSLLAYFWLVFIIELSSPSVIDIWEAVTTMVFLPILIVVSYIADVGRWPFGRRSSSPELWVEDLEQAAGRDHDTPAPHEPSPASPAGVPGCVNEEWAEPTVAAQSGGGAGVLAFDDDMWEVMVGCEQREVSIPVLRQRGSDGLVLCRCRTEGRSAAPGRDYVEREVDLEFQPGATQACVSVELLPKSVGEESRQFALILEDVRGGAVLKPPSSADLQKGVLIVTVLNEHDKMLDKRASLERLVDVQVIRGSMIDWYNEVVESIFSVGEEDEQPTTLDWFFHVVGSPWKLIFAVVVPPAGWMGGWLCFCCSLLSIGAVTSIVIDFAELFGCVTNIPDSITAITFVALGTSMPDLFASVSAARADEWADASIVNVTGSNSVNVFVGIGVPWTMSAIYWSYKPEGVFVVHGDDLAFSVVVFTIAALMALAVIRLRRVKFGGELGGPCGSKVLSALLMMMLWVYYIALSVWKVVTKTESFWTQVAAIFIGAVVLEHIMLLAGLGMWLCMPRADSVQQGRNVSPMPPLDEPPPLQGVAAANGAKHSPAPIVCGLVTLAADGVETAADATEPASPQPLPARAPPPPSQPQALMTEGVFDSATAAVPTVPTAEVLLASAVSFAAAALVVVAAKRLQRRARRRSDAGLIKPTVSEEAGRTPRSMLFHTRQMLADGGDAHSAAAVPASVVQMVGRSLSEWAGAHKADCMAVSSWGLAAACVANGPAL